MNVVLKQDSEAGLDIKSIKLLFLALITVSHDRSEHRYLVISFCILYVIEAPAYAAKLGLMFLSVCKNFYR